MKLGVHLERWAAVAPFRIAGRDWTEFESLVVEVSVDGVVGRGEALGVFYLQETATGMLEQVNAVASHLFDGIGRDNLQRLLPAGGARNALDCALWDLECKASGRRAWHLAGVEPRPVETVYTIGIEPSPEAMATKAIAATEHSLLKIKLDANQPIERLTAIREARPDARLVIDANQSWTFDQLAMLVPQIAALNVLMIEQPLPRGQDEALARYRSAVPLCADESCLTLDDLPAAAARYQMINIKLDKTGGLTHALALARAAKALGLGLMVGNMCGSSLALAPAVLLAWLADLADLDGPLLQRSDRLPGLTYQGGWVAPFEPALWG